MSWAASPTWGAATTCFVLGGGRSLDGLQVAKAAARGRVIAINNAYALAAAADCLYFADRRWFQWHHAAVARHAAPLKVTRAVPEIAHAVSDLRLVEHDAVNPLSLDPTHVAGLDSGANAINLALHLGARRIVLLGFDMKPGHWHGEHPDPTPDHVYARHYLPHYERMAPALIAAGVRVINATPDSALAVFPKQDLEQLL